MTEPTGQVAWIAIAPVESMALTFLERTELGVDGIAGDRAFAVIDEHDRLVNGKRAGSLATIIAHHQPATNALRLVTTHDPNTGRPSFATLHVLNHERGHLPTSEPLPFGVWAEVVVRDGAGGHLVEAS